MKAGKISVLLRHYTFLSSEKYAFILNFPFENLVTKLSYYKFHQYLKIFIEKYCIMYWWPNVFVGLSVLKRTFKSWWEPNLNAQNSKLFVFNNKFKKKLKCFFVLQTVFDCTLFCHVRAILLFRIVIHLFWPVKCQIID